MEPFDVDRPTHLYSTASRDSVSINSHTDSKVSAYIKRVLSAPGYLVIHNGVLSTTSDVVLARSHQVAVKDCISSLDGKIHARSLILLKIRHEGERIEYKTSAMPSSQTSEMLESEAKTHGLAKGVELLEDIQQERIDLGARFGSVDSWPTRRDDTFLHVVPNVQGATPAPAPATRIEERSSVLLTMMEPSLEESMRFDDLTFSNATLLITSKSQIVELAETLPPADGERLIKQKDLVDTYYRSKVYFRHKACGREFIITPPTTRYAPNQFLALSVTGREDILEVAAHRREERIQASQFVDRSLSGRSKTIDSFSTERLSPSDVRLIVARVDSTIIPSSIVPNRSEIRGIHAIISELPANSLVGQNSIDSSTDPLMQHLQCFTDAPCHLIPAFSAPTELKYVTEYEDSSKARQTIEFAQVRSEDFPGTIYKVSCSSSDETTCQVLCDMATQFSNHENNGSLFNVIAHKKENGSYEYYFVLRKSITVHPHLQTRALAMGLTRPGWAEAIGIRIAKTEEAFTAFGDRDYVEFLNTFGVEPRECALFEECARMSLRGVGPLRHNLLETNLKALRSDAETSQMTHAILLSGSKSPLDPLTLITHATSSAKPNIMITALETEDQSFHRVASNVAEQLRVRIESGLNFGVVAVDSKAVAQLTEFKRIQTDQALLIGEFHSLDPRPSVKEFLLSRPSYSDPEMRQFLSLFNDHNLSLFLQSPIPVDRLNLHQAIMLDALKCLREEMALPPSELPDIRYAEYSYGNTTLTSAPTTTEEYLAKKTEALLLGGSKFNTSPPIEAREHGDQTFIKHQLRPLFHKLIRGHAPKEKMIEAIVTILDETVPKSSIEVKKLMKLVNLWIKDDLQEGRISHAPGFAILDAIETALTKKVAVRMFPIFSKQAESYRLQDLSLTEGSIPPEFQSRGRIVPCSFESYISPYGTRCSESVAVATPVVPVGRRLAVIMNGGQASGVADVAIGALLAAGPENQVDIFIHGNEGLIRGDSIPATLSDLPLLRSQGGFPGGTTRAPLINPDEIAAAQKVLQKYDGVIFIGGDGSFRNNKALFLEAGVPVYFCIKTIDGDFKVEDADLTLGFYTAIEGYGAMIEERRALAKENHEFHFIQVGGRFAGYLAVGTSALLEPSARPNLSIFPEEIEENRWSLAQVITHTAKVCALRIASGKNFGVFTIAEGVIQSLPEIKKIIAKIQELKKTYTFTSGLELKRALLESIVSEQHTDGEISLPEVIEALSDEDIQTLSKPDAIGRIPVAQIDTYALIGRLTQARLAAWHANPATPFASREGPLDSIREAVFSAEPLSLTAVEQETFLSSPVPGIQGTKSNYDQRSRQALKRDADNGLAQGMCAASAALSGLIGRAHRLNSSLD